MNKKTYIIISLLILSAIATAFTYYYFQVKEPLPEVRISPNQEEKISTNGIIKSISDNYLTFISDEENITVFLGEDTKVYRANQSETEEGIIPKEEIILWANLEENENVYVYAKKIDGRFIAVTIIAY
jgi:uncharacterized protein YpmB